MRMVDLDLLNEKIAAMQACEPHYAFHFLNDAQNPSTEWECIEDIIENMPVIEAQPVKRGKWITTQKTIDDGITTCSYCHREFYIDDLVPVGNAGGFCEYCPACGADMRGGDYESNS